MGEGRTAPRVPRLVGLWLAGLWLALASWAPAQVAAPDPAAPMAGPPPGLPVEAVPAAGRPNILVLVADDLGVDRVGAYAEHPDPGSTPMLDRLAAAGVLFRNAWSNPTCSPTRATLLTGRYSFRTGVGRAIDFPTGAHELAAAGPSLPRLLRQAAVPAPGAWGGPAGGPTGSRAERYTTYAIGKWHLASAAGGGHAHPLDFGFDRHLGPIENLPDADGPGAYFAYDKSVDGTVAPSTTYATTEQVDDALAVIVAAPGPWMVWLAFTAPHGPFHAPPAHLHTFALPPEVNDDVPLHHKAMTEAMDTEIARLLAGIPAPVMEHTYVVFLGDNGTPKGATTAPFPDDHAKATPFEGGVNVPLIIAGPGVAAGAECAALVNTTDLFATVLEWAGVPAGTPGASSLDSVSLTPYLSDPGRPSLRPWVYAESFAPNGPAPWATHTRIVRDERHKLIDQDLPGGATQRRLYDLLVDPFEQQDLLLLGGLTAAQQEAHDGLLAVLGQLGLP